MKKILELWNILKQKVQAKTFKPFFHEREIWWVYLGKNIGFEQDGKGKEFSRPVLILVKFNKEIFWGIPLTRREKEGKFYFNFFDITTKEKQTAILSQMKPLSSNRLQKKIGKISKTDSEKLKEKLKNIF